MEGEGFCTFLKDRDKNQAFQGIFSKSYMDKKGAYSYPDGRVYGGGMELNVKKGTGVMKWIEGYIYTGSWDNGLITGTGLLRLPDNSEVNGEFTPNNPNFSRNRCCNNNFEANCFLLYNDGTLYLGECKEDTPSGYGRKIYGDQRVNETDLKYFGNWKQGLRNGQGMLYFTDGSIFFGNFTNDYMNGKGLMLDNKFKSCYDVEMENRVELNRNKMNLGIKECQFKIEGKRIKGRNEYCMLACEECRECKDEDNFEDVEDFEEVENFKNIGNFEDFDFYGDNIVVEYNKAHCQQLHGKYCNQVNLKLDIYFISLK
jgi:hypothetical protein